MSAMLLMILGGIIALGFLGNLFSERTRMPDLLLLIGIGLLIGPILEIVPPDSVRPFMPAFGAIALTIILFEGGLDLDLRHTIRQAGRAILLAVLSFGIAMLLGYYALSLGMQRHDRIVWAFAAALACTSAPIVIPVLARVLPGSPMRPLLAVESALSDALAVIVVLLLQHFEGVPISGVAFAGKLGWSFLIGAVTAVIVGLGWLWLLSRFHERKFFYLMTIGVVFLMMGGVEHFHGSGALAVLVFGILLANGPTLVSLVSREEGERLRDAAGGGGRELHDRITESHAELSLVTRTFFFVYLGMIFRWPGEDPRIWLSILLVMVGLLVGREIAVQLVGWSTRVAAPGRRVLSVMLPRGLATAVLSALLVAGRDGEAHWETIATFVVVLTNIWMSIRLLKLRGSAPAVEEEAP